MSTEAEKQAEAVKSMVEAQRSKTNATPIPESIPEMSEAEVVAAMEKEQDETEAEFGGEQLSPEEYLKLLEARKVMGLSPLLRKEYVAEDLKDLFSHSPMEIAATLANLIQTKSVVELHLVVGEAPRIVFMAHTDGQVVTPEYIEEGKRMVAEGEAVPSK